MTPDRRRLALAVGLRALGPVVVLAAAAALAAGVRPLFVLPLAAAALLAAVVALLRLRP